MRVSFLSLSNKPNFGFKQKKLNDIKVSVILPIYNQEKYLTKALNSLQKQTLRDIEIICINDGSQDNSLKLLEEFAENDSRIKIINQQNHGSGPARNKGLKLAKGEYIAFLDPDDWLEPEAFEILYNKSKKQNCDMVVFNFKKVSPTGETISQFDLKKRLQNFFNLSESENFNWRDFKPKVFGGIYPTAWNKFYNRTFVEKSKLHFTKCSLAEDNVFVFGATLKAKDIGFVDKSLYNYQIHENSAIRSRSDKHFSVFKSLDSVKKLLSKLNLTEELKNEFDKHVLRIVSFHARKTLSISKFIEVAKKRLSPLQNQILKERHIANSKIMPIINALLKAK